MKGRRAEEDDALLYEAQRELVARWLRSGSSSSSGSGSGGGVAGGTAAVACDEDGGPHALLPGGDGSDAVRAAAGGGAEAWRALVASLRLPSSDDSGGGGGVSASSASAAPTAADDDCSRAVVAAAAAAAPPSRVAVAYSRACILAAEHSQQKQKQMQGVQQQGLQPPPLYHTLEEDAEDAAGCAPPAYEDAAADVEALRWRNATRAMRVAAVRKEAAAAAAGVAPMVRTAEAMGSYARLAAAARQQCSEKDELEEDQQLQLATCECAEEHQDPSAAPWLAREDRAGLIAGAGFCPEITASLAAACVPDLPPPVVCRAEPFLRPGASHVAAEALNVATAKLLLRAGFASASQQALDVLVDATGEYIRRTCTCMRMRFDNLESRSLSVREVNRGLRDLGLRGVASIRQYHEQFYPAPPPAELKEPKAEQGHEPPKPVEPAEEASRAKTVLATAEPTTTAMAPPPTTTTSSSTAVAASEESKEEEEEDEESESETPTKPPPTKKRRGHRRKRYWS